MRGDAEKRTGQCLSDETLTGYLEDALEPVVKAACEVHLISCDKCRRELAMFMRVLRADITPEEEEAVAAISAAWESRKGGALPPRERKTGTRRLLLFLGGVAVLATAVFVGMRMTADRSVVPRSGGEIVQLLLNQNRPFEGRLSGGPHRPLVQTRSADSSTVDYGLLESGMSQFDAGPYDMGRFYLVRKDFDSAIRDLEIAARNPTSSAEVLNDLGVAYMERGGDGNLAKGAEQFQRALKLNPNFAPAVFNLSLAYDRMDKSPAAAAQLRRYLELDSTSEWAMEVRTKLQGMSR